MTSMKIINPTVITDARLGSASVAEPDPNVGEVLWSSGVAYAVGNQVVRTSTHCVYERLVAGTTATPPESDTVNWLNIGPTNRWAMFDRKVGTATTAPTSMSVTLRAGGVSGLGMLEIQGRQATVSMTASPGGTIVYSRTIELDGTLITSVYDWFFAEYEQLTDFVLTDLPQHYAGGDLTINLTGTSGVAAGVLQVGQVIEVGDAQYGATVGILDYSVKQKDQFGNWDIVERSYSKHCTMQVVTAKADFNKLYRRLASLRATPCIYIGVDEIGFEPMISYGFYKDFGIAVSYPDQHLLNIELEGL